MALMKSNTVPQDAVVLDELEATKYAWEIVSDWESLADTWALRYGPVFLGGLNAVTGLMINRHYRFKLKLGTYGYFASVIPITIMPGILTGLFHRHLVSTEMLLMKQERCPICLETRSAAIQLLMGTAYPMVLGPASAMMFANRYCTYRIPDLTQGPKVVFQFVRKLTKPFTGTLTFLVLAQLVSSSVVTYFEMRNHLTLRQKIMEIEAKLEEKTLDGS